MDRLRAENPETIFKTIHLACTGADTVNVAQQIGQIGSAPAVEIDLGIMTSTSLVDGEEVDALLISAGANDEVDYDSNSFGASVNKCLAPLSNCDLDEAFSPNSFKNELRHKFNNMQPRYDTVQSAIEEARKSYRIARTYITGYFDPTKDEFGQFGGAFDCTIDLITDNEWAFLYRELVVPLNGVVEQAALTHGWTFVDGIAERFVNHGYCARGGTGWVVDAAQSLEDQNGVTGTAHPNKTGQGVIADQIYHHLLRDQPPRTTATGVAGGAPYQFGTLTNQVVTIDLVGRNLRGAGADRLLWSVVKPPDTIVVDETFVHAQDSKVTEPRPHLASVLIQAAPAGPSRLPT